MLVSWRVASKLFGDYIFSRKRFMSEVRNTYFMVLWLSKGSYWTSFACAKMR